MTDNTDFVSPEAEKRWRDKFSGDWGGEVVDPQAEKTAATARAAKDRVQRRLNAVTKQTPEQSG